MRTYPVPAEALVETRTITRIGAQGPQQIEDILLREESWRLICDGQEIFIHHCLPLGLEQLAVGHLRYRKLIQSAAEIAALRVLPQEQRIEIDRQAPPPGYQPRPRLGTQTQAQFSAAQIHALQQAFNDRCGLFRRTGSAHSCALADASGVLLYFEDLARHNAMDKVLGEILLQDIAPEGKVLFFSGRLALDMVEKAAATGVAVLVSPGAPSLTAVELAEAQGLTLLGFVRPDNINIYTHPGRIVTPANFSQNPLDK